MVKVFDGPSVLPTTYGQKVSLSLRIILTNQLNLKRCAIASLNYSCSTQLPKAIPPHSCFLGNGEDEKGGSYEELR